MGRSTLFGLDGRKERKSLFGGSEEEGFVGVHVVMEREETTLTELRLIPFTPIPTASKTGTFFQHTRSSPGLFIKT